LQHTKHNWNRCKLLLNQLITTSTQLKTMEIFISLASKHMRETAIPRNSIIFSKKDLLQTLKISPWIQDNIQEHTVNPRKLQAIRIVLIVMGLMLIWLMKKKVWIAILKIKKQKYCLQLAIIISRATKKMKRNRMGKAIMWMRLWLSE